METILITGATGNVGLEILRAFKARGDAPLLLAGARNPKKAASKLAGLPAEPVAFDFTDPASQKYALERADSLFLLRPPQISNVGKYFAPLIARAKAAKIRHIVFLSVQGVENSKIIPHHKIERLVAESGIPYTFLRPAYFLQNFTTTLRRDLVERQRVFLPAGKAKFTIIDAADIGAAAAEILDNPESHINKAYELTNYEKLTFGEMAARLSEGLGRKIEYISPNLLRFFFVKWREGMPPMFILVMIMLHYLPRFQSEPQTTERAEQLAGRPPKTFRAFVAEHKDKLA